MKTYSDLVDRVFLQEHLLRKLIPSEPLNYEMARKIQSADDASIAGETAVKNAEAFSLVRGGLLYALDAIHEAHAIFQDAKGDLGSYWHGMMHRREGDFDNARYWFRRAGVLPVFAEIHRVSAESSADMARQMNWDPYLFTGKCEQARFGETEELKELEALQNAEFVVLFDYCWRTSFAG